MSCAKSMVTASEKVSASAALGAVKVGLTAVKLLNEVDKVK